MELVNKTIQENHLLEIERNEVLSAKVFHLFFEAVDPTTLLICESDKEQFRSFEHTLFEDNKICDFIESFSVFYKSRIKELQEQLKAIEKDNSFFKKSRRINYTTILEQRLKNKQQLIAEFLVYELL